MKDRTSPDNQPQHVNEPIQDGLGRSVKDTIDSLHPPHHREIRLNEYIKISPVIFRLFAVTPYSPPLE